MNNEIIISNIAPQDIIIEGGGSTIGLTAVYVNGVNVTVGSVAYVIVPTKLSELKNNVGYITSETDPTVPTYIKQITMSDITSWNNKQNLLVSGTNIKTINNNSILGSGNLDISTSYTAGTGIEITEENVINNTITSYNDLTDRPTIPTHTSDLINDSNFVNGNSLSQVAYTGDYYDLIGKPDLSEYITKYVDNLVNYYTKDYMYGLLPKVSDEDTSITLNNTYPSELKLSLSPSELSQDGEPTPSTPYDIHTISGDNTIKVCNKNILDFDDFLNHGNAVYTEENGVYNITNIRQLYSNPYTLKLVNGKTYTLSQTFQTQGSVNVRLDILKDGSIFKSSYSNSTDENRKTTFTADNSVYTIRVNYSSQSYPIIFNKPQLEVKDTATSYEPHQEQTAQLNLPTGKNIGENNIESQTKGNLTITRYSNGTFKVQGTDTGNQYISASTNNITLEAGTYTLSGCPSGGSASTYDLYLEGISGSNDYGTGKTFTITQTTTTRYTFRVRANVSVNIIVKPMIEVGSSATSYEPYGETPIEYSAIGNYKDEFYKATDSDTSLISGKWYLKKNIGKITYDGTEYWELNNSFTNVFTKAKPNNAESINNMYSNYFKQLSSLSVNESGMTIGTNINLKHLDYTSVDEFKNWLSTHNTIVYYILSTSTYTLLNDTLQEQLEYIYNQMLSYQGQTSISQVNDDLPFIISGTTLKDISSL